MTMAVDKQDKVLNVPTLRFPEFSGEYIATRIGKLTNKVGSGVTPKGGESVYTTEGHPFVRSQNVGNGQMFLDEIAYIDDATHSKQSATEIQNGDVLLNITGASIGRCCVAANFVVGGNVNQHVCIVRPTQDILPYYLCCLLLSDKGQKQIDSFQAGGNRQGLNFEQIKSFKFSIPKLPEQMKVSELLALVDERITTQIRIIDKLQSLMKGLNDYLQDSVPLSYSLSFSDIGEDYSGLSGKTAEDFGSGKPYITYVSIYANNFVDDDCSGKVSVERGEKQNVVQKGDMLFTLSSETPEEVCYGAVYSGNSTETYLNSFCFGVRNREEKVFSPYMAYYFNSSRFRREVYPLAQGSTRFNLQKSDFLQKQFSYPSIEDQHRIFEILNAYDNKIRVENQILAHYQLQKEFLLRNLFI